MINISCKKNIIYGYILGAVIYKHAKTLRMAVFWRVRKISLLQKNQCLGASCVS